MGKTINEITAIIIEESIEIHKELGPGLLESVHEVILTKRLRDRGLEAVRQVMVPIIYQGHRFDEAFRLDLLVEGKVVVELKSLEVMPLVHFKKVTTYLRLTGHEVALLINFGAARLKDGLHRVVNKYAGPLPGWIILRTGWWQAFAPGPDRSQPSAFPPRHRALRVRLATS